MATAKQAQEQPTNPKDPSDEQTLLGAYRDVILGIEGINADTEGQIQNRRYKYLSLNTLLDEVKPKFRKHHIGFRQEIVYSHDITGQPVFSGGTGNQPRKPTGLATTQQLVTINTIIFNATEEKLVGSYPIIMDGDPKKAGSAITYGRRYALCAALGIYPDPDDDGNAASQYNGVYSPEQRHIQPAKTTYPSQQYQQSQQRQYQARQQTQRQTAQQQQPPRQQQAPHQQPQQQYNQSQQQTTYQRAQPNATQTVKAGGITDQQIQQLLTMAEQGGIKLPEVLRQYKGRPVQHMRELTERDYEAIYQHLIELQNPQV